MPWIIKLCEHCQIEFTSKAWKGHERRFCSNSCRQQCLTKKHPEIYTAIKVGKRINQCRYCGKDYWQRHVDKYFCDPKCYSAWRKQNTPRTIASESIRIHGKSCERCGESEKIECHHLDYNPKNNPEDGSNWMRLCVSCHKIAHFHIKKENRNLSREEIRNLIHKHAGLAPRKLRGSVVINIANFEDH